MDPDKQRILGYFIEEANEHLENLEKGILELRKVVTDPERVNDLFRAAHSVKGGAAMLGFGSIQKTAHRLEDYFKILKESHLKVDQKLESLFLEVYKILEELIKSLQGPFGLREDVANKMVQEAEPTFVQLQDYLNSLTGSGAQLEVSPPSTAPPKQQVSTGVPTPTPNFAVQATSMLRQMLQLFKQKETPESRKQLLNLCDRLMHLGDEMETWQVLVQTCREAIANPRNSYPVLALVVIKEIKQASDLVRNQNAQAIAPSQTLQQLASAVAIHKHIAVAVEPKAAANALIQAFSNKEQLKQLVELLQSATR